MLAIKVSSWLIILLSNRSARMEFRIRLLLKSRARQAHFLGAVARVVRDRDRRRHASGGRGPERHVDGATASRGQRSATVIGLGELIAVGAGDGDVDVA